MDSWIHGFMDSWIHGFMHPTSFEFGWPHVIPMNLTGNVTIQYQTGAPISRAAFKLKARLTSAQHTAAERAAAYALAYNRPRNLNRQKILQQLFPAWDAVGIVQHHDAMTGTMSALGTYDAWGSADRNTTLLREKLCTQDKPDCQTLEDYTKRLDHAQSKSDDVLTNTLDIIRHDKNFSHVTVFNPLAKLRATVVHIPLSNISLITKNGLRVVTSSEGKSVKSQLSPQNDSVAIAITLAPLSSISLKFESPCVGSDCAVVPLRIDGAMNINNSHTTVTFGNQTGLPAFINGQMALHRYGLYNAEQGGPYVLIETNEAVLLPAQALTATTTFIGPILQEVVSEFNLKSKIKSEPGGLQRAITRIYADIDEERASIVELEHSVPRKIPDNTELIMHVTTGLKTRNTIWIDESGLEMHQHNYNSSMPISGNYHAMVMSSSLRGDRHGTDLHSNIQQQDFSILTQHTMGVASLADGDIEYMMARNIVNGTDDQGPWPLRQLQGSFTFPTWIMTGDVRTIANKRMPTALRLQHPPVILYGNRKSVNSWKENRAKIPLSDKVHLISFHARQQPDGNEEYVVRVQNVVAGSGVEIINIADTVLNYTTCTEMTLSLQEKRVTNEAHRLRWNSTDSKYDDPPPILSAKSTDTDCAKVTLGPLDIRTFLLTM